MSKRLQMIFDMIPRGSRVADIGCDHGLLCEMLAKRGDSAIGIDISALALNKAKARLDGHSLFEARVGDGFDALVPGEVNCAVIAGIGGEATARILERTHLDFHGIALILQPSTGIHELREYLASGFEVNDEKVVFEHGRYYFAIAARFDGKNRDISGSDIEAGKLLLERREPLLTGYLEWRLRVLDKALKGAEGSSAQFELKKSADAVKEGLEWLRR